MRCTCGEPDEIGLTPMGVKLNGSRRVRVREERVRHHRVGQHPVPITNYRSTIHGLIAVHSISFACLHARCTPMLRPVGTCR